MKWLWAGGFALVYCAANFAEGLSFCTAPFLPFRGRGCWAASRQMRTAYSRTRHLPHLKVGIRPIGTFLRCPCSGLLLNARSPKFTRMLGKSAQHPGESFCATLATSEGKPLPATAAPKGGNTAFHSFVGTGGYHPPCRRVTTTLTGANTGLCRFGCGIEPKSTGHWQRMSWQKICCSLSDFLNFLDVYILT